MEGISILGRDPPSQHRPYPTIPAAELAEAAYEKSSDSSPWLLPSFAQRIRGHDCGGFASRPPSAIGVTVLLAEGSHHARRQRRRPESPFQTTIPPTQTALRDMESRYRVTPHSPSAALASHHHRPSPIMPDHAHSMHMGAPKRTRNTSTGDTKRPPCSAWRPWFGVSDRNQSAANRDGSRPSDCIPHGMTPIDRTYRPISSPCPGPGRPELPAVPACWPRRPRWSGTDQRWRRRSAERNGSPSPGRSRRP